MATQVKNYTSICRKNEESSTTNTEKDLSDAIRQYNAQAVKKIQLMLHI